MNICRLKQNKHGFTLAELLVVVAILMILAGVSFVAINEYIRNLQVLEMDNTAKEIFIVAQNHLSQADASGELQREGEDGDYYGNPIPKPNYLNFEESDDSEDTGAEYYYCHYDGYSLGSHEKTGVLSTMLPKYSIDDEIADYGNYIIVYEKNTATVQGVFYNGKSHTYFGSIKPHDFSYAEARGNDDTLEATNKSTGRDKRKHYLEDSVIGWYGADGKDIIPEKTFEPLTLRVTNGSTLKAVVTNPNYSAGKTSQVLNLIVIGLTSGKETTISLTNGAEVSFDLDDITRPEKHFCNLFPDFIPGENLRIYAKLSDTSVFAKPKYSNEEVENSLFESYSDNGSEKSIAEISNIRHLENLDYKISKLGVNVEKAEQTDNLIYSGSESFVADTNNSNKVYPHENSEPLSSNGYYSVSNDDLIEYDGQNHTISAIHAETGVNGNIGIFSETSGSASRFRLKNLTVKDSSFNGTNDTAALIGHSNNKVVINNCTVDNTVVNGANDTATFIGHSDKGVSIDDGTVTGNRTEVNSSSGNAGGLVGACDGNLEISDSIVSGNEVSISATATTNKSSGGMVGACKGGDLTITNGDVEGAVINVSSASGSSGGFIGDAAAVTFTSSFLKADTLAITGNANAGGIIGKISGVSTLSGDCFISGNLSNNPNITIKANAGNAGGVIGYSTSQLTVTGFDINGSDFTSFNIQGTDSTGGNAGGIVGKAEGPLTIDTSYVIGKFLNLKANNAGGVAGSTSGNLDIKNTYASAYVFGISNAGGFIGSINGGIDNKIDACYASGHTKNGSYSTGTVKTAAADNYNVQSGGNSGGFIGYASSVTVSNSYTTCSAYSSAAAGYAGGFAGQTVNMSVSNCYSAGLVGIATGGKIGGFAGFGTVSGSATGNSYYLKGNGFNDTLSAGSSGSVISYVLNTAGSEIQAASMVDDTNPWDTVLASKKYKYKTTYMLSGNTACMSSHYGDWTEVEEDKLTLSLVNAEKLTAILSVPTSALTGIGNYASFLVEGKKSGKAAYMQFELSQHDITPIDKTTAIYNITLANGGNPPNADQEYLSFPEYTFPSNKNLVVKTEGSYTEFHIDLDDITTVNKNFASIFTAFTPGEDIRVTAEWGALSWDTMMTHADQKSQRVPITGITNSLFASGSGNSNYTDKNYYSDRFPTVDIIDKDASASAYSGMALVTNFRHLQNLDTEVSNVSDSYTKAKICRDLYWDTTSVSDLNTLTSGDIKAFVPAIRTANGLSDSTPVKIYSYNAEEPLTIESKSAFYGIVNPNLEEFDGDYHSVNNILIYNDNNTEADGSAGFFRTVTTSSSTTLTKTIKNFTIVEPVVVSEKGAAGGLIGDTGTGNAGTIAVHSVYVYGQKAIVRTLSTDASSSSKANAGGLIGTALLGGYTIENSGASVYVYAEKARCAGGFIGSMQPRITSSITNCFVGGHVGDEPNSDLDGNGSVEDQVYLKTKALKDVGTIDENITVKKDGGYNVVSIVAVGGFVGYVGTSSINGNVEFKDCFTTASAYSSKAAGGTIDYSANGGAVGGFIGRLQHKNQKYERCYAEGKVWSGADTVGMFAGQFYNASESTKPTFKACLVLTGLYFNTDLCMMYNSSTAADTVSGITPVESDAEIIRAKNPEYIHVEVFNKTLKEFPYKDLSTYPIKGQTWYVFFGDWVEPEKLSPITVVNENRLIAAISLRDETTGREYHYGQEYDVTYIRVKNPTYNTVFRVLHKNGVIYKTERFEGYTGAYWGDDPNDDTKWSDIYSDGAFSASISGGKLDFYIDDISHYKGCYRDKVRFSTAGEDIIVYTGASYNGTNGVMSDSAVHDTGNSLFQKAVLNPDGATYTVYISNSRHLQNLDTQISGSVINVSKAIQTDDIYWQDDGTRPYSANTKPYLTEMTAAAHIFRYNATGINDFATPEGCMLPITKQSSLKEYDGGGYEIHGIQLGSDHSSDSGLFGGINDSFAIYDLVIKNSTVRSAAASGVLIGKVASDLTVTNVWVNGKVDVYGVDSGGLIGYIVSGNVTLKNDSVFAGSGTVSNATNEPKTGNVGGLIGRISGGNIKISNSFASANVIGDGTGIGGFIGAINPVNPAGCTGTISNCYSSGYTNNGIGVVSVTGRNCKGIGGFIGYALGVVTIEKCFSTCYITSACATQYPGDVIDYMGGFVGIASGQLRIDSCYTISDVIPTGVNPSHYGLFAGITDGSVAITDSYYINRFSRLLNPIAVNGTDSVVNPDNVYDPGNNIYPEHILGNAENATLSAYTYHHDTNTIISAIGYPYKNWTDANGGVPESTPLIVFYGDW